MSDLAQQVRDLHHAGQPVQEIIAVLQEHGVSLIQSMRLLKQGVGLSLADARELVLQSPHWADVRPAFNDTLNAFFE
jgi:hypothetical protein